MKENRFYSLDLTTMNNLHGGFRKLHKDVTLEDLSMAFKGVSDALRKKAIRQGWRYIILAGFSNVHLTEHRKGAWHIHVIVYGSPASVICKSIKDYWTKHRYGNPRQQIIQPCYNNRKARYMWEQASSTRFYSHDMGTDDLIDSLQAQYCGRDITPFIQGLRLDNKLTDIVFLTFASLVSSRGFTG